MEELFIQDGSTFNLLRNHWTVFHSNYTILLDHQQCTKVPVSPHPYQHLFSDLLVIVIVDWKIISTRCSVTKEDSFRNRKDCSPVRADEAAMCILSGLCAKAEGHLYVGKRNLREREVRTVELYDKHGVPPVGFWWLLRRENSHKP